MQEGGSSEEFLESVKVDLFPDKVYVFTPKGEILRLPRGATVVDFAYAVHTDVGNRCVAAKVDRRLTPLRTPLRNGQTVEIITAKGAMPNPSWVNFVVTAKARAAVRHYLKGLAPPGGHRARRAAHQPGARGVPAVARGSAGRHAQRRRRRARHARCRRALRKGGPRRAPRAAGRAPPAAHQAERGIVLGRAAPLAIAGTEGLLVSYARCCFPIPDDPIFAFLSAGRGVVVHRENCVNVEDYRKHPENWLPVAWQATTDKVFSSEIRVDVANKMGVLAAVAAAISSGDTNIERVAVEEKDADSSSLVFELRVRNREHLARVVKVIRRMPEVLKVTRTIASHGRFESRVRVATPRSFAMGTVRQAIHTDQAPKAIGPYSQAVRVGDTVYLAGQIPLDPATMQMVEGDFEKEARRVFENIKAVIAASGGTFRAGREGHDLPDRLRQLRQGQRDHGAVLQRAVPGALDRRGGGTAAQRARRSRVHAAPGLSRRSRGNARATRHAAGATPGRIVARRRSGARREAREARRHAGAGPAVRAAVALRRPHAGRRRSARVRHGMRAVVEGEVQLTEVAYRRRRQLLCRIADGTGSLTLRFFYFSGAQQAGLARGTRIRCFGEVRRGPLGLEIVHPEYRRIAAAAEAARGSADTYLPDHRGRAAGAAALPDRAGAEETESRRARLDPEGRAGKIRAALAQRCVDDDASSAARCAPGRAALGPTPGAAPALVRRAARAPALAALAAAELEE